ncbi:hypothetical protein HYV70_04670 [Candidatus Uhrbacteria bacterium]|nr:hypothetical protein [Candidatus Uhrbacteria bacterium]
MKTVGFSTTFIWFIIVALVCVFFVPVETSQCPTGEPTLSSVGICAGEALTSPTLWSVAHQPLVAETKFLLLILVAFTALPNIKRFFVRKTPQKGITRHTPTLSRFGPAPPRVFLPCLFATHDW